MRARDASSFAPHAGVPRARCIVDVFHALDRNGDGVVTRAEFAAALPLLGFVVGGPTEAGGGAGGTEHGGGKAGEVDGDAVVRTLFDELDVDGSGSLDYKELRARLESRGVVRQQAMEKRRAALGAGGDQMEKRRAALGAGGDHDGDQSRAALGAGGDHGGDQSPRPATPPPEGAAGAGAALGLWTPPPRSASGASHSTSQGGGTRRWSTLKGTYEIEGSDGTRIDERNLERLVDPRYLPTYNSPSPRQVVRDKLLARSPAGPSGRHAIDLEQ